MPAGKDGEEGGGEGSNEANYVEWMQIVSPPKSMTSGGPAHFHSAAQKRHSDEIRETPPWPQSPYQNLPPELLTPDASLCVSGCAPLQDHPRPCVSLQKSPFYPDIYMTVGDWNFRLWKVDCQTPIFTSANASTYITVVRWSRMLRVTDTNLDLDPQRPPFPACPPNWPSTSGGRVPSMSTDARLAVTGTMLQGRWSVTRPGVLLIAKVDGSLDVWDFTDTSYKCVLVAACQTWALFSFLPQLPSILCSGTRRLVRAGHRLTHHYRCL